MLYTKHALTEMENEDFGVIKDQEISELFENFDIIKEYSDDKPYPSALLSGYTKKRRPLHVVCAINKNDNIIIIVTVYHPDPNKWIDNKRRLKK